MRTPIVILIAAGLVPSICAADSAKYQCSHSDLVRRVEVVYTNPGSELPCEVHYYKDTEAPGGSQILWSASNEIRYCETKAAEFIDKLRGWGWTCDASDAAPAEPAITEAPEEAAVTEDDLVEPEG